jgi:tripeptidyl-peptidase-1
MTLANELLGASYQLYRHVKMNETIVRTISYALPAALHGHVSTVAPTTHFDSPHPRRQTPRKRSGEATAELVEPVSGEPVTVLSSWDIGINSPSMLRWLYNTRSYTPTAMSRNMLGIVGFLWDYPSPADLAAFMRKYRSDGASALVQVDYGKYPSDPDDEASLDLQYAQGMAYPTPHVYYSTGRGPSGNGDWYLSWLDGVLKLPILPQTISISYAKDENKYDEAYAAHVCQLFGQLGLRGVSVLVSTGNDGVGIDCLTGGGSNRFSPMFPATCTCGICPRLSSST